MSIQFRMLIAALMLMASVNALTVGGTGPGLMRRQPEAGTKEAAGEDREQPAAAIIQEATCECNGCLSKRKKCKEHWDQATCDIKGGKWCQAEPHTIHPSEEPHPWRTSPTTTTAKPIPMIIPPRFEACRGKEDGATCTLCAPNDKDCHESQEGSEKTCQDGECKAVGATTTTAKPTPMIIPRPFEACRGKDDGATCTLCAPQEEDCFETQELKTCQDGQCKAVRTTKTTTTPPAMIIPRPFEACRGKDDGAICTLCAPKEKSCHETEELKTCQDGECKAKRRPITKPLPIVTKPPPIQACADNTNARKCAKKVKKGQCAEMVAKGLCRRTCKAC